MITCRDSRGVADGSSFLGPGCGGRGWKRRRAGWTDCIACRGDDLGAVLADLRDRRDRAVDGGRFGATEHLCRGERSGGGLVDGRWAATGGRCVDADGAARLPPVRGRGGMAGAGGGGTPPTGGGTAAPGPPPAVGA